MRARHLAFDPATRALFPLFDGRRADRYVSENSLGLSFAVHGAASERDA